MAYVERSPMYTEEFWLRQAGIENFNTYIPKETVRIIHDARFKFGRLLIAAGVSLSAAIEMNNNPGVLNPIIEQISRGILMYVFALSSMKIVYGTRRYKDWMEIATQLKEVGVVKRWLQKAERHDPIIAPLVVETMEKLEIPFDETNDVQEICM